MKTCNWLIALGFTLFFTASATAQCVTNLQSESHDTTVTSLGGGLYQFTFPRFNAALGTLVEVEITADISLTFNFTLENGHTNAVHNYKVTVFRDDQISSDALLNPIDTQVTKQYGNYSLAATDGIAGSGADFTQQGPLTVMDHVLFKRIVYNTADFMGAGNVAFDYYADSYTAVSGNINNTFNGSAGDMVTFGITYKYCDTWFLDADLISFTARKKENTVDLQWISSNEKSNRVYELQKSSDGRHFVGVDKIPAKTEANAAGTGSYRYQYALQANDKRKIIFRLKQVDKDGTTKYSKIRIVELPETNSNQLRLYPNPAKGQTTMVFSNTQRSDWDVEVYTVNMQLIKKYRFKNALLAKLNSQNELAKGMYIIKAVNLHTQELSLQRLVIQ